MTVTTEIREKTTACNGVTTSFAVGFQFSDPTDLFVELIDTATDVATALSEGVDFTLSGSGAVGDATITTLVAYPAGASLHRYRDTRRTQETVYTPNDGFPAKTHEAALDKLTMVSQEIAADFNAGLDRTQLFPVGEQPPTLPSALTRAGKFRAWDAAGNEYASAGTGADAGLRTDLAAPIGAGLSAFTRAIAYSAGSTGGALLRQHFNPMDLPWGAVGGGITDDTAALVQSVAAAVANGRPLEITGIHRISVDTTIAADLIIRSGGFQVDAGKKLTINGLVDSDLSQIFFGAGAVVGIREVWPEWFGAKRDGVTDDLAAFNAAQACVMASSSGRGNDRVVRLAGGVYALSNTWVLTPDSNIALNVRGAGTGLEGTQITALPAFPAAPVVQIKGGSISQLYDWTLRDFKIAEAVAGASLATYGLQIGSDDPAQRLYSIASACVENVYVFGFNRGIKCIHVNGVSFRRTSAWRSTLTQAYIALHISVAGGFTGGLNFDDGCKFVSSASTIVNSKAVWIEGRTGKYDASTGNNSIGGIKFGRTEFYTGQIGCHIQCADGVRISDIWFKSSQWDFVTTEVLTIECNKNTANVPVIINVNVRACYLEQSLGDQCKLNSINGGVIRNVRIRDNWLHGAQGASISAYGTGCYSLTVADNHILDNNNHASGGNSAIDITAIAATIRGNIADRDDGSSFFTHLVNIGAGSNHIVCEGNISQGISGGTIVQDSSGSVTKFVANNL